MKATRLVMMMGLLVAAMGAGSAAFAHSDKAHDKKTQAAVKKEQQEWGIAGDARAAKRTVEIKMSDNMRFTPDKLDVRQGETIRFVPYMAHVAPGKTGEIIWTFNRAGEFDFACLIAGHYSAGMKGVIRVTAKKAQ